MVDIEFTYKINGQLNTTNYTNITIIPNFTIPQVILIFPQSSVNYDALYNDMINPPTNMKVKFSGFGADVEFEDLKVTRTVYIKNVDSSSNVLHDLTVTLQQIA